MSKLGIVRLGHPALRTKSKLVTRPELTTKDLQTFLDDLAAIYRKNIHEGREDDLFCSLRALVSRPNKCLAIDLDQDDRSVKCDWNTASIHVSSNMRLTILTKCFSQTE